MAGSFRADRYLTGLASGTSRARPCCMTVPVTPDRLWENAWNEFIEPLAVSCRCDLVF
jgi:hypothetical protein